MKKYMAYCLATIFVLLGHSGNGQTDHAAAQTSARARQIADSICQTRMLCSTTTLELIEEVYYPMTSKKSPKRKTDLYYFSFKVYIKEDIESQLNIAIRGDLSIEYISGVPDKNFAFSPCDMLSREALWKIAKNNGLKTKFKHCKYHLVFDDNGLYIHFITKRSNWDLDVFCVDAITGQFIEHVQTNKNF